MLIQNKFKKKMNQIVRKLTVLVLISFSCFLLTRCTKMNHDVKFDIKSVEKKTEIHLTDDQDSPTCSFAQVYTYLDESSKDTLIQKINSNIKEELFGPEYKLIPNEVLVDSFLAKYIVDYKADCIWKTRKIHQMKMSINHHGTHMNMIRILQSRRERRIY